MPKSLTHFLELKATEPLRCHRDTNSAHRYHRDGRLCHRGLAPHLIVQKAEVMGEQMKIQTKRGTLRQRTLNSLILADSSKLKVNRIIDCMCKNGSFIDIFQGLLRLIAICCQMTTRGLRTLG